MRRWKHDVFRFKDILALHVGRHIAAIDKQQQDLPNLLREPQLRSSHCYSSRRRLEPVSCPPNGRQLRAST